MFGEPSIEVSVGVTGWALNTETLLRKRMILFRLEDGRLHIEGHVDAATIHAFEERISEAIREGPTTLDMRGGRLHRLRRAERALEGQQACRAP